MPSKDYDALIELLELHRGEIEIFEGAAPNTEEFIDIYTERLLWITATLARNLDQHADSAEILARLLSELMVADDDN